MLRARSLARLMFFGGCAMLTFAQSSARNDSVVGAPCLNAAQGRVGLAPITLHITEYTKRIYEMVCKLASINVYFHPEVNSRRIHVELNGVRWGRR